MSALASLKKKDLRFMMLSKLYILTPMPPRHFALVWSGSASTLLLVPGLGHSLHPSQRLRDRHPVARHRSRLSTSVILMWISSTSLGPATNAPSLSVVELGRISTHRGTQNTHVDYLEIQSVTRHKYCKTVCILLSQTSIQRFLFTPVMWWLMISGWLTRLKR